MTQMLGEVGDGGGGGADSKHWPKKKKKINVGAIPVMPVFYKSTERSERGERRVNR